MLFISASDELKENSLTLSEGMNNSKLLYTYSAPSCVCLCHLAEHKVVAEVLHTSDLVTLQFTDMVKTAKLGRKHPQTHKVGMFECEQ